MGRLLVVDDNELVGKLVTNCLARHGWEVEFINKPFGVLNKIKEYRPDVILLDLKMPGLSGAKLASLIKGKKDLHGFKVILFSTEDAGVQEELVRSGLVDGYFVKSNNLSGLAQAIKTVVEG